VLGCAVASASLVGSAQRAGPGTARRADRQRHAAAHYSGRPDCAVLSGQPRTEAPAWWAGAGK